MLEEDIMNGQHKIAEFLFDGDREKAKQLLILIKSIAIPSSLPDFKNITMQIPEGKCTWCDKNGDCWYYMPDSKLKCRGECKHFEEDNNV